MINPQKVKIVEAITPKTDAAGTTGDYVSLKNANMCTILLHILQGNAATVEIGVNESALVNGAGAAAITKEMRIYSNLDCAASDTIVKRTDAATYTTDAAVRHKIVAIEIDPVLLSSGMSCIAVTTGASNAGNILSAVYILDTAYLQETPPSVIVD